jgi:ribosomal protein S4
MYAKRKRGYGVQLRSSLAQARQYRLPARILSSRNGRASSSATDTSCNATRSISVFPREGRRRDRGKGKSKKLDSIGVSLENREQRGFSEWLEVDKDAKKGKIKALPERKDMPMSVQETLIIEYYSK